MNSFIRTLFLLVLVFAVYHFLRDLLQIAGVENTFTNIFHWRHTWCGNYCEEVTLPIDISAAIGVAVVLRRNYAGTLGIVVLSFPPLLLAATVLLP